MWKLHEILIKVSIHKVLWYHNDIHLATCYLWLLLHYKSKVRQVPQISWLSVWPFTKMFADPYLRKSKKWVGWNLPESSHSSQYLKRPSPHSILFFKEKLEKNEIGLNFTPFLKGLITFFPKHKTLYPK